MYGIHLKTDDELQREYEKLDKNISERMQAYSEILQALRDASVLLQQNREDRAKQMLIFSELNKRRKKK